MSANRKKPVREATKANTDPLNARQLRFVDEYPRDLIGWKAAIRAGYSEKSARTHASALLSDHRIVQALEKRLDARSLRTEIAADLVLKEVAALASSDLRRFLVWRKNGTIQIIPSRGLSDADAAALAEISQTTDPRGRITTKFKLHSKPQMLELLARHLNLVGPERPDDSSPEDKAAAIKAMLDRMDAQTGGANAPTDE